MYWTNGSQFQDKPESGRAWNIIYVKYDYLLMEISFKFAYKSEKI